MNFAIANGLSRNSPRKYWLIDRVRIGLGLFRVSDFLLRFTSLIHRYNKWLGADFPDSFPFGGPNGSLAYFTRAYTDATSWSVKRAELL